MSDLQNAASKLKPDYYKGKDGKDLFDRFEEGLLSDDQVRGFYQGNIIKYVIRYKDKNGTEDLEKAKTYLERLENFENANAVYGTNGLVHKVLRPEDDGGEAKSAYGNGEKVVVDNNDDAK